MRVPVLVIVGEKEMADETVSVRRGTEDQGSMSVPGFVEYIRKSVAEELAQ
jgi:threonyl-tRNA synthetase